MKNYSLNTIHSKRNMMCCRMVQWIELACK